MLCRPALFWRMTCFAGTNYTGAFTSKRHLDVFMRVSNTPTDTGSVLQAGSLGIVTWNRIDIGDTPANHVCTIAFEAGFEELVTEHKITYFHSGLFAIKCALA
jgi:FAD/FMN-containing dehydrogenase